MINGLLKDYCHAKKNGSEYFISNSFYSNETEQPMHKTLNKRSKLIVREELLLYQLAEILSISSSRMCNNLKKQKRASNILVGVSILLNFTRNPTIVNTIQTILIQDLKLSQIQFVQKFNLFVFWLNLLFKQRRTI